MTTPRPTLTARRPTLTARRPTLTARRSTMTTRRSTQTTRRSNKTRRWTHTGRSARAVLLALCTVAAIGCDSNTGPDTNGPVLTRANAS